MQYKGFKINVVPLNFSMNYLEVVECTRSHTQDFAVEFQVAKHRCIWWDRNNDDIIAEIAAKRLESIEKVKKYIDDYENACNV